MLLNRSISLLVASIAWAAGGVAIAQPISPPSEPAREASRDTVRTEEIVQRAARAPAAVREAAREAAQTKAATDEPAIDPRATRDDPPSPLATALERIPRTCSALQTVGTGLALVAACAKTGVCAALGPSPTYCKVNRWL